jgi:hypothetical protein
MKKETFLKSYIILVVLALGSQVGLRLMEMNVAERQTMGRAADYISTAAKDSIKLVQDYFEARGQTQ